MNRMKTCLLACALGLALLPAAQAQQEKVRFPAGLKWQTMPLVTFDYPGYHEGTPAQRKLAKAIWAKEIESMPVNTLLKDGGKYSSFILLSAFEDSRHKYFFSILSAAADAYEKCEDPPNGSSPDTPMYSKCPMRVVIEDKATGQMQIQDFQDYCHLYVDDPDAPASKNHTEIAIDDKTRMAYFRVIQYGRLAPECNRAIRLR